MSALFAAHRAVCIAQAGHLVFARWQRTWTFSSDMLRLIHHTFKGRANANCLGHCAGFGNVHACTSAGSHTHTDAPSLTQHAHTCTSLSSVQAPTHLFPFVLAVYADGAICLDILQNQWSPIYDVSAILTSIQVRLHPHAHDIHGFY